MIYVTRIVGESYDLTNGKELPKGLVLSNGQEEILLFVEDHILQSIVRMSQAEAAAAPAPKKRVLEIKEEVQVADESDVRLNPGLLPEPVELPQEEPSMDDGPGDDYDDPTTGVSSL